MTLPPGSPVPPGWASVTMGVPSAPAQEAFSVERETEARSRGPARSLEGVDSNTRPRQIPGYVCWGEQRTSGYPNFRFYGGAGPGSGTDTNSHRCPQVAASMLHGDMVIPSKNVSRALRSTPAPRASSELAAASQHGHTLLSTIQHRRQPKPRPLKLFVLLTAVQGDDARPHRLSSGAQGEQSPSNSLHMCASRRRHKPIPDKRLLSPGGPGRLPAPTRISVLGLLGARCTRASMAQQGEEPKADLCQTGRASGITHTPCSCLASRYFVSLNKFGQPEASHRPPSLAGGIPESSVARRRAVMCGSTGGTCCTRVRGQTP